MLFIINGYPCAGKDTFTEIVKTKINMQDGNKKVLNISTIDYLKAIFKNNFGWKGEKTKEVRQALASIHQALGKWNDIPFKQTRLLIDTFNNNDTLIFLHCREPENIKKYVNVYGAKTIYVDNKIARAAVIYSMDKFAPSDIEVENYKYDIIINNNGTFENLETEAERFIFLYINERTKI